MINYKKTFSLLLGPLSFAIILLIDPPAGMSTQAKVVLASTAWVAIWWISEAIPIAATSLLPIVLFPLTGGLDLNSTTEAFGHRLIFLYIGGFIIAIAIEKWNLHRRIALNIISIIGVDLGRMVLGFMVATAFLSMWISNTATTVMMLPIGMAIVVQLGGTHESEGNTFGKVLMLAIAYSASIGGIATLIGTPPNLVLAAMVQEFYGIDIGFAEWFLFGFPISITLLAIAWMYLTRMAFPLKGQSFPGGRAEIQKQLKALGAISKQEKLVLIVFALTAFSWISRSFLLSKLLPGIDDTIIAIAGAIILFMIPSGDKPGEKLLNWEAAVKIPWGVILLFGGGLSIAAGFIDSGLADWIGNRMTLLEGVSLILILLAVIGVVNFLTEITSNLATTSMILPVMAALAMAINVHPYALMVGAAVAASCAFMLPVATPPNAVVFGSGYLKIGDMIRVGFVLNIISILIILLSVYFLLPVLWGVDLTNFPAELR
ncbi:MAG: DASS family sodium-coupled anion symporter [Cyclobacteriaceae bacterium]